MADYRKDTEINKCQRCGYSEFKEIICVHHIDEDRKNNADSNKIILCYNCHMSLHFGLWCLKDIGVETVVVYTRNDGIKALQEKIQKGEAVWQGRGPDKNKRNTEGYKKAWEKRKALKVS